MATGAFMVGPYGGESPRDIYFSTAEGWEGPIPQDQSQLRDDVERTLGLLRILFPQTNERFREYYNQLLALAQAGLVGASPQPILAKSALTNLKDHIAAREASRIKSSSLKSLGAVALLTAALPFIGAMALINWVDAHSVFAHFLFMWVGCMAGAWLSFGVRKRVTKFEDLLTLEQDRAEGGVRLFFAGGITIIVGLLLSMRAVIINIGSFQSWQFTDSIELAILLGMLCGLTEQALSDQVVTKAVQLLSFGEPPAAPAQPPSPPPPGPGQ